MNHELHSDYDLVFESDEIEHNFSCILVSQEKIIFFFRFYYFRLLVYVKWIHSSCINDIQILVSHSLESLDI